MSFSSTGAQEEIAGAVTDHLSEKHGVSQSDVSVSVVRSSGRRLQSNSWQVDYEIQVAAGSQAAATHLGIAQGMSADLTGTASELAASFAAAGLDLDPQSLTVASPRLASADAGAAESTSAHSGGLAVSVRSGGDEAAQEASSIGVVAGIAICAVVLLGCFGTAVLVARWKSRKAQEGTGNGIALQQPAEQPCI